MLKSTYYKFISYKVSINMHSKTSDRLKNNIFIFAIYKQILERYLQIEGWVST